jgi:hypothetical protein
MVSSSINYDYSLTPVEQETIEFARQILGSNLADFLLAGLGETKIIHYRVFTAQCIPSSSVVVTYEFETINESQQGLPIDRDPLVFAVLLNLLWERKSLDGKLFFRYRDILKKLQWPPTTEYQMMIQRAIERYFLTAYYLIDPTIPLEERLCERYAGFGRLMIGYEPPLLLLPEKKNALHRLTNVRLFPEFIQDIASEKKRFLGLNFEKMISLQHISQKRADPD